VEAERLGEDDRHEIGKLYEKTRGQTAGMIRRILALAPGESQELVDDLTEEVYLKVIRYRERFLRQPEEMQYGCLVMMIRNVCTDHQRRAGLIRFSPLPPEEEEESAPSESGIRKRLRETAEEGEDPPETLIRRETAETVRRAIDRLDSPAREIVVERYYFGRSYGEIAREHRMSSSAVGVVLHRSLKKIGKELHDYVREE